MKIVSAGHPPIIYFPIDENPYPIEVSGDVIGMFNNIVLEVKELKVKKGDRFFLYSDGIIEEDGDKKITRAIGIQRLLTQIEKTREISLAHSIGDIMTGLFQSGKAADDDILLMGIEV